MISGYVDSNSLVKGLVDGGDASTCSTKLAHIFPQTLAMNLDNINKVFASLINPISQPDDFVRQIML